MYKRFQTLTLSALARSPL